MTVKYLSALGKAVNEKLILVMGAASKVFHYNAEGNPSFPYVTYRIQSSGPAEYTGTGAQNNVYWPVPVLVQVFANASTTVAEKLQEAEQQLHLMKKVDDGVIHCINTISIGPVEQDPERETDATIVWMGSLLVEVLYGRSS